MLRRPEFADFWALKWADLLRVEEKTLDARGVRHFHGWIRRGILPGPIPGTHKWDRKAIDRALDRASGLISMYQKELSGK